MLGSHHSSGWLSQEAGTDFPGGGLPMAGSTLAPDDDYDVLIHDEVANATAPAPPEPCAPAGVLSARQTQWLFSLVCVTGLLDPAAVAWALARHRGLAHAGNVYLAHWAVAGVGFLLPLPFWAHPISGATPRESVACRLAAGCHAVAVGGKVFFLLLLVLQSHRACVHARGPPPGLDSAAGKTLASVLAWGLALLLHLPELAFSTSPQGGHAGGCAWSQPPFAPTAETWWRYLLAGKTNLATLAVPLAAWQCRVPSRARQDALSRLASLLLLVFLLLWAPYNVALLLSAALPPAGRLRDCGSHRGALDTALQVTKALAIAHCGLGGLLSWIVDAACRGRGPRGPVRPPTCAPDASGGPPNRSTQV